MIKRSVIALSFIAFTSVASAQQPMQQMQQNPKEETELKAEALQLAVQQRNCALDSVLACQASGNRAIDKLQKENADLRRQLAEASKPKDASPQSPAANIH